MAGITATARVVHGCQRVRLTVPLVARDQAGAPQYQVAAEAEIELPLGVPIPRFEVNSLKASLLAERAGQLEAEVLRLRQENHWLRTGMVEVEVVDVVEVIDG